jgi:hypothetical protein
MSRNRNSQDEDFKLLIIMKNVKIDGGYKEKRMLNENIVE